MTGYSLAEVVKDGIVTAPRWFHHSLRALLALGAFVLLQVCHVPTVEAGFIAAFGVHAIAVIKEHFWPTDHGVYPFFLHATDFLTDLACACVALVAALLISQGVSDAAVYTTVLVVTVYAFCHHGARP